MPSYVYQIACTQSIAEEIVDFIFENEILPTQAASVMETQDKTGWIAEIYFVDCPDKAQIKEALNPLGYAELIEAGEIITLDDIDWVRHALDGLSPIEVGPYFVHGAHDQHLIQPHHISIHIEASHAFGTGHHPTTEGCLALMNEHFATYDVKTILDVGCGSAVLAIAAAKHIKATVIGTEIDPPSAHIARENVALNEVSSLVHIQTRGDLDGVGQDYAIEKFDLIIANILAKPLIMLAQDITEKTAEKGHIILSGLLATQEAEVNDAYMQYGFICSQRFQKGEWIALKYQRGA